MSVRFWPIAAGLGASVVFAAQSAGAPTQPSVAIRAVKPEVLVAAEHFRAREYVRTTLSAASVTRSRLVRVSALGTFYVNFGALPASFDPCNDALRVVAHGRTGDEATFKFVSRQCAPRG